MKPLLAATLEKLEDVTFPKICSPKLDGIRCLVMNGVAYSRTLKPIPNKNVQSALKYYSNTDGEIIIGSPTNPLAFRNTTSIVMSDEKPLPVLQSGGWHLKYYVFDDFSDPNKPYKDRMGQNTIESVLIRNITELKAYEKKCVDAGYEGIMLRNPDSPYKFGRSTVREAGLLKFKRFHDDEAICTGYEQRKENNNVAVKGPTGSKKPTKQANIVLLDTIGALNMEYQGQPLSVGSGLDDAERARLWKIRDKLAGKIVKFKYQKTEGIPRFPVYLGIRDARDM